MENPWQVENLDAFSYLCCPECVFRCKEGNSFEAHAVKNHPQSVCFFSKTSGNDLEAETSAVKEEKSMLNHEQDYEEYNSDQEDSKHDLKLPNSSTDSGKSQNAQWIFFYNFCFASKHQAFIS